MPFPSLSRPASKGDRDEKIQPPKQLAKKGIPLYILKKCLEGDGGQLKFRPQVKSGARAGDLLKGDGGQVEQGLEFEVEIHSYGTMSRERRKEMLDLVEENMKAMYDPLAISSKPVSPQCTSPRLSFPVSIYNIYIPLPLPCYSPDNVPEYHFPLPI